MKDTKTKSRIQNYIQTIFNYIVIGINKKRTDIVFKVKNVDFYFYVYFYFYFNIKELIKTTIYEGSKFFLIYDILKELNSINRIFNNSTSNF